MNINHIRMLVPVPPHLSVSEGVRHIKGGRWQKTVRRVLRIEKTAPWMISAVERIFCRNIRTDKCKGCTKIYRRTNK